MSRTRAITATLLIAMAAGCTESSTSPLEPPTTQFAYSAKSFLICPVDTTRSVHGTLGLLGGTIALDGHSITLPPGAVLRPTDFTLTVPKSNRVEIQIHADGHDSFRFLLPATVTISYDRCERQDFDPDALSVWHIDEITGQLLELMAGIVDPDSRDISFSTGHLSGFVIAN